MARGAVSVAGFGLTASIAFAQEMSGNEVAATDITFSADGVPPTDAVPLAVGSGDPSSVYVFEAVQVQARRHAERLVDVPVSTTVVDGEALRVQRAMEVKDSIKYVPGWEIPSWGENPTSALPIVRGIGSVGNGLSPSNSSAPVFVDGVPLPVFAASSQMLDVSSVEALRGPQGTLFGRNSTAGALLVNTVVPDGELFAQATGEFGTDGYWMTEGIAGAPMGDKAAARASVRFREHGNYISNLRPGQEDAGENQIGAARFNLRAEPSDRTDIKLGFAIEGDERHGGNAAQLNGGDIYALTPEWSRDLIHSTLNITHDLDSFRLKSITGFTYWDQRARTGTDGLIQQAMMAAYGVFVPLDMYDSEYNLYKRSERQFYQEVQAQSPVDSDLKWVVGGTVLNSDYDTTMTNDTPLSSLMSHGRSDEKLDTLSYGVFGDTSYTFLEDFEIGAGMRYTHERVKIDAKFRDGTVVTALDQENTRRFDMLTGRLSLGYKPTKDSLVYTSFSRGAKAGGFPQWTFSAPSGQREKGYDDTGVWAYEVGAKGSFLDGALNLALSGYYNDIRSDAVTGMEASTYTIVTTNVDMETYGFELEGLAHLPYGFSLSGALTHTQSEITGVSAEAAMVATRGARAPLVPLWAGNVVLSYEQPLDFLNLPRDPHLNARVGYRYTGKSQADMKNNFELDEHHALDARIGVAIDGAEFYLFGENLIGKEPQYVGYYYAPGVHSIQTGRGRTLGMGLTMRF